MDFLRSIAMAFSMFSRVPVPMVEWKKENMKYMLAMLPLVGAFIGAFLWLWFFICEKAMLGGFFPALGYTAIPVLITGGIHMDGFADTVDALSSHADPEKKREILKDPNAGAFAIIFTVIYFLAYFVFSFEASFSLKAVMAMGGIQIMARVMASFSSITLDSGKSSGLLSTFREASHKKAVLILIIWAAAGMTLILLGSLWAGFICIIIFGALYAYVHYLAKKQFNGMSGDLAGYINQLAQLIMLMAFVLAERI